jgi:hypothetical protein
MSERLFGALDPNHGDDLPPQPQSGSLKNVIKELNLGPLFLFDFTTAPQASFSKVSLEVREVSFRYLFGMRYHGSFECTRSFTFLYL